MIFYVFKMAVAIVLLCENAVEAILISFISVNLPLWFVLQYSTWSGMACPNYSKILQAGGKLTGCSKSAPLNM